MKTFKMIVLAAAVMCSVATMAQDRPQRGQGQGYGQMTVKSRAERETAQIHGAVELTDAQIASIFAINYKYAAQDSVRMAEMRAARQQGQQGQQFDREAWMKQRQETQEAKTAEIKAVLTDAQKTKYDAMIQQMQERMRQGFQGQGQRPQGQRPQGQGRPQGDWGNRQN